MNFGWRQLHFVGVVIAGFDDAREDVPQLGFVADELQQGFIASTRFTDAKYVFGGRIEANDEQGFIEKDDACAEAVENLSGMLVERAAAGAFRSASLSVA